MAAAGINTDGYIRCCKALHLVVNQSLSCIGNVLKNWHVVKQKNLLPCSRPRPRPPSNLQECSDKGKPTPLSSCPNCVAWGKAVEDVYYPPSAEQNMSWENVNPMCLSRSHIQVAKAFILRLQNDKQYSKLEHLGTGSLLSIMMRFKEFHKEDLIKFDAIMKVSELWNKLCQMQLDNYNQHLHVDAQLVDDIFRDLNDFVSCLKTLHPQWYSVQHAQDVRRQLTEIKTSPVTAQLKSEVLESVNRSMDNVLHHTEQRHMRLEEREIDQTPESKGLPKAEERELDSELDTLTGSSKQLSLQHGEMGERFQQVSETVNSALRCLAPEGRDLANFSNRTIVHQTFNISGDQYLAEKQTNVMGDQTNIGQQVYGNVDSSTNSSPTDTSTPTSSFNLKNCQDELSEFYLDELSKVQLLPWEPTDITEMEAIFVDLELIKQETATYKASEKTTELESNEDLVTLKTSQGKRVNRILIQGEAGSGKSTLTANVAYKWALQDPESPLSQFQLVFVISMHEIPDRNTSLVDLIFQQLLPEDSMVSKEGLESYITEHASDVLLLIDGLDEDSSGTLKNKSSEITKILHNRNLRKSCVILTTRPHRVDDLGEHQKHYTQVKLKGFSEENVSLYLMLFFQDDRQAVRPLHVKLKREAHIMAMATTPVLLLMICLLWKDQCTLPDTKTQLYQQTIKYLWRRYHEKIGENPPSDEESDEEEFQNSLSNLINSLGKVALDGIMVEGEKVVFNERDFMGEIFTLSCRVGLMTKERLRSKLNIKKSVTFLHKSFQDFCAGMYLSNLLDTDQSKFNSCLRRLGEGNRLYIDPRKHDVLEFCSGIRRKATLVIIKYFVQIALESNIFDPPRDGCNPEKFHFNIATQLQYVFESRLTYEECLELVPINSKFKHIALTILPEDIPGVLYMLKLIESTPSHGQHIFSVLKSLNIRIGFKKWFQSLLKHTVNLEEFYIVFSNTWNVSDSDLDTFYEALIGLPHLKNLLLQREMFFVTQIDITNLLCMMLSQNKDKYESLSFTGFHFGQNTMAKVLSSNSSLRSLLLGSTARLGCVPAINYILGVLPELKKLNMLYLLDYRISSSDVRYLRPNISELQSLTLTQNGFTERQLQELFSFLNRAQKLTYLNLSQNTFTVSSVKSLARCLPEIPHLEELHLNETGLNDDSACILATGLTEMTKLQILSLYGNPDTGSEGKNAVNCMHIRIICWDFNDAMKASMRCFLNTRIGQQYSNVCSVCNAWSYVQAVLNFLTRNGFHCRNSF